MNDYCVGIAIGFLAAGVIGYLLYQFRLWRKSWQAMSRPQKAEVVTNKGVLESKRTPLQVVSKGLQAGCLIALTLFLIGVALWLLAANPP